MRESGGAEGSTWRVEKSETPPLGNLAGVDQLKMEILTGQGLFVLFSSIIITTVYRVCLHEDARIPRTMSCCGNCMHAQLTIACGVRPFRPPVAPNNNGSTHVANSQQPIAQY